YDVHEYYGLVYAERLGIGGAPGRWLNRAVNRYQVRAARRVGGVNAAAEGIAELFKDAGVPVIVTLNAPLGAQFQGLEVAPFHERATKVVHIGTLNESYGMRRLLRIAAAAQARGLPHSFDFVDRFHNASEREAFEACFAELGRPSNVKLVPPRPAHQVGELLAEYGVGLAVFTKAGQNNLAQPGKLFEYSLMGLAVVATKAAAQERFLDRWAVARICPEEQIEGFVDALEELAGQASQLDGLIAERMATARQQLTWESISSPKLMSLYRQLINGAQA
ncbi:MAG: hypothetical protein LBH68_05390, partial [Bifidobacteriaceae bacterium]|nr:hypothetical protein [Bifidobacteriaceae bacterium]